MDVERFFDLTCSYMAGEDHRYTSPEGHIRTMTPDRQRTVLGHAMSEFVLGHVQNTPSTLRGVEMVKLRAFSGSSDLPQLTTDVFTATAQTPEYDLGWSDAFRSVPLMKGQLSWEIASVSTGTAFELIREGDSVSIHGVSGEKKLATIQKYGAGFGVTWETIEGRKLYEFVQAMENVRDKLYRLWADIHYGLLAAAAKAKKKSDKTPSLTTYQGKAADSVLSRDIATLNAAYLKVARETRDSGYGMTATTPMILYVSPALLPRLRAAMGVTTADVARGGTGTGTTVPFPLQITGTWTSAIADDTGILVLPGHRIQNAIYMREAGFTTTNNLTLSDIMTYWSAFGAMVADDRQTELVKFS